jgi:hypothetical protein
MMGIASLNPSYALVDFAIARRKRRSNLPPSFQDGALHQTSDVQLHIGESRDSGFDASHRPGMTGLN